MPHQIIKNKNVNEKKSKKQRSSSVLAQKRTSFKKQTNKKKNKGETKSKDNKGLSGPLSRKMSRSNINKPNIRPSSEYIFNKHKSISVYNQSKKG